MGRFDLGTKVKITPKNFMQWFGQSYRSPLLNALVDITILSQSTDLDANFDCQFYYKPLIYISANKSNVASLGAPNIYLYKLT